jgi:hypothetical protein
MAFITPAYLKVRYGPDSGKLPVDELTVCGTTPWVMWHPAARCHRAMMAAAREAGFTPRSTGTYRSYARQEALFRERYSPTGKFGGCKTWRGVLWCKQLVNGSVPADAAVPGTSEHGWGCADDVAEANADGALIGITQSFYLWLVFHARSFGFENTNRTERWHWAYCLGGEIPPRVLAYENPEPVEDEDMLTYIAQIPDGRFLLVGTSVRSLSRSELDLPPYAGQPVTKIPPVNDATGDYRAFWLTKAADEYEKRIAAA